MIRVSFSIIRKNIVTAVALPFAQMCMIRISPIEQPSPVRAPKRGNDLLSQGLADGNHRNHRWIEDEGPPLSVESDSRT